MHTKALLAASMATIAIAAPTALETRQGPEIITTVNPTLSIWQVSPGRVTYDTSYGQASRAPSAPNGDITTLLTFNIPSQYRSNTCEFIFTLNSPSSSIRGPGTAQLFQSQRAARPGATSNYRDNQVGTIRAVKNGQSTFGGVDGSGAAASLRYPCATLIDRPNYEVAPQGGDVGIFWQKGDGLKVNVLG